MCINNPLLINFFCRYQDGYEFATFSDDEAVEVEEEIDYFAVKPIHGCGPAAFVNRDEALFDEEVSYEDEDDDDEEESSYATPASSKASSDEDSDEEDEEEEEEIIAVDTESSYDSETNEAGPTSGFRETSTLEPNINNLRQGISFDANVTC